MKYITKKVRLNIQKFHKYFENLPKDKYIEGDYRFRRYSRFKISKGKLVKLLQKYFVQLHTRNLFKSKKYTKFV